MLTKEWIEKYNEIGSFYDFHRNLIKLHEKGEEFFEFDGVKIRTDAAFITENDIEFDKDNGIVKYKRYKCESHPFEQHKDRILFLTHEFYSDSRTEDHEWYFEYSKEVTITRFYYAGDRQEWINYTLLDTKIMR